jgi:2,4-dichlorophenol 6-monooxygenase
VYQPSTRPGSPLPHAWIDDEDGRRRPVKDLLAPGRFLLIAGEDGQAWCEAARQLAAEADVRLDALRSATSTATTTTRAAPGCATRQSASDGAVLVRPDRFIAWRHPAAASDPRAVLTAALSQILGRRAFAQPGPAGS